MFTEQFEQKKKELEQHHRKGTLHRVVIPIAAGSAAGLATKKYWMPEIKAAIKGHRAIQKIPEHKIMPMLKKTMKHQGKGVAILLGSAAGANFGARYLIDKTKKSK